VATSTGALFKKVESINNAGTNFGDAIFKSLKYVIASALGNIGDTFGTLQKLSRRSASVGAAKAAGAAAIFINSI
jgi:hypothetical protein